MTPALAGLLMYALGWVGRRRWERKARNRARSDKQVLCDAITRLEAEVAALLSPVIPAQRYKLTCPDCGEVEVITDIVEVPATDEEFQTALEVILTEHQIAAHLDSGA